MATSNKINLTGAKETLFITLCAKAIDCQAEPSMLHDAKALEILNTVGYDFTKLKGKIYYRNTVCRAKYIDEWVKEFITTNENAIVLYIGCGLDSRVTRINPPSTVNWYDLDFPEVIEVRKSFYSDTAHYKMLAASATDKAWLSQIPNNRSTIIVAEGVLEYLAAEDVKQLIGRLADYFDKGQMVFDVMSKWAISFGNRERKMANLMTDSVHFWGIDDISEINTYNPKLERMDVISIFETPYVREMLPTVGIFAKMINAPELKNVMRLLRYKF